MNPAADEASRGSALSVAASDRVPGTAGMRTRLARRRGHLVWWHELLIVAAGYLVYTLIRNGVPAHEGLAFVRAFDVIKLEQALHIFHELAFNQTVAAHRHIAQFFNYYYAVMHFVVTIAVGIWLLFKRPQHARALRSAWYAMNVVALVGFAFFPLAPPRLTGLGFVDTVVQFHTWGSWGSSSVSSASNQFAAMPSMHIGWSLWCGIVLIRLAKPWWLKALGAAYPLVTLFVIIGTANHFFLDAIGGVIALALGFAFQRLLSGRKAFDPDPRIAPKRAGAQPAAAA